MAEFTRICNVPILDVIPVAKERAMQAVEIENLIEDEPPLTDSEVNELLADAHWPDYEEQEDEVPDWVHIERRGI